MVFLIQDILDFTQINSGKFRKNIKEFDILEAIEEVMSMQRSIADTKGIKFYVTYQNIEQQSN